MVSFLAAFEFKNIHVTGKYIIKIMFDYKPQPKKQ